MIELDNKKKRIKGDGIVFCTAFKRKFVADFFRVIWGVAVLFVEMDGGDVFPVISIRLSEYRVMVPAGNIFNYPF